MRTWTLHQGIHKSLLDMLCVAALLCNYFGQGACCCPTGTRFQSLLRSDSPIFALSYVLLATVAAIIASQSMITGMYSSPNRPCRWACCPVCALSTPRARSRADLHAGSQLLLSGLLGLGALFRKFEPPRRRIRHCGHCYHEHHLRDLLLCPDALLEMAGLAGRTSGRLFLAFDVTYFGTNLLKILDGGCSPVGCPAPHPGHDGMEDGRAALAQTMSEGRMDVDTFLKDVAAPVRSGFLAQPSS